MRKIKVLLGARPRMLAEVIRNMVERQPDMEVVGEELDPIELLLAASTTPVDVVIVTPLNAEGESKICRHLLAENPQLRIVTLSGKGNAAFLYILNSHKKRIDESSESSLLDAMRASGNQGY
jgi:DNA-binding NarL/FixJ family response regulator